MVKIEFLEIVLLIIITMLENSQSKLRVFEYKYENFSQILFHSQNDQKYAIVSGKNFLLKFSVENPEVPLEIRRTGPVNDSVLCAEPKGCRRFLGTLCKDDMNLNVKCRIELTDVYVKSWTIAQSNLVVCYNAHQGFCETIDLYTDFSSSFRGRSYSIVTYDLNSHSTILHFENKLYVAIEINMPLNHLSIDFNTISIRTLPNLQIVKSNELQAFYPFYGRFHAGYKPIFPLEFKGSFHIYDGRKDVIVSDYIFFLINQPENKLDPKNGKFQMRLVRLCSKDDDFSSLIDIGLFCHNDKAQVIHFCLLYVFMVHNNHHQEHRITIHIHLDSAVSQYITINAYY